MTDDKAQELARLEAIEKEMFRAINCLYIAVESSVAQDIQKKAEAYCLAVRALLRSRMGEDRWIPVSERLPEDEEAPALIAVRMEADGHDELTHRWIEIHDGTIYKGGNQIIATLFNGDEYENDEIVGWRPLPSPPAEEGK